MDVINRIVVAYLLNSLWQVTLIAAFAFLCAFYLRRMPGRYRHNMWVLCLAACVLVPVASVVRQGQSEAKAEPDAKVTGGERPQAALSKRGGWSFLSLRSRSRPVLFTRVLMNGLAFAYLALLLWRSGQLMWIYGRTSQIRSLAYAKIVPRRLELAAEKCQELFGMTSIPLLCSEHVESPSTVGWRNPVLLVPCSFFSGQIGEAEMISALSHEMAHIRRSDFLLNLVYEVLSLPMCIHPGIALIKSRIAQTRELACDEMAAGLLPSGKEYARSLLRIAQEMLAGAPPAKSNYAMGLFDTQVLEERIMNILRMPKAASRGSRTRTLMALVLLSAVSLLASAFSVRISADSVPGDTQRFVGTWVTKYKGQAFITLKIKSVNGVLGGSCIHVDQLTMVNDDLIPSSDKFVEQEIVQAKASGNKLDLRIGGHDSIHFELTLKGTNDAEVIAVGDSADREPSPDQAPPQKKPWQFQRVAESQ